MRARHLNKEMFCRKIENNKQNKFENRNEIKNKKKKTTENKLNLDKLLSLKRTAKLQKELKNLWK